MAPQSPQLVMRTGPHPGKTYPLEKDVIQIGRDVNNDIIINNAEVSRRHARILHQGGAYLLEDLGSTNGTFVDGERVSGTRPLRTGETITLGENVSLAFEAAPFDPDATIASPGTAVPSIPPPQEDYAPLPRPTYISTPVPRESVPQPQPLESYPQPQPYFQPARPPETMHSGQVPPVPADSYSVENEGTARRNWILGGCVLLVIVLCAAVFGFFWYIDTNYLWCPVFPFIPGC